MTKQIILNRFLKYVKIETASNPDAQNCPSTQGQMRFAKMLAEELKTIGASKVRLSEHGYVMAEIPASAGVKAPAVGFIAHMDTSPDFNGKNVNPRVHKHYRGGAIVINKQKNMSVTPSNECKGHDIITTDGTSLLGADDKAGIAIIMTLAETLIKNPQIKHGPVKIAFTPDEEIGRGADKFDVASFGAKYAYTIDGDKLGSVENGSFNADAFKIEITGVNCHPGSAKNILVNPVRVAADLINSWPVSKLPETTEGTEGFILFNYVSGNVEKMEIKGIIREHDLSKLHTLEKELKKLTETKQAAWKGANITLTIKEQYRNMKIVLDKNPAALKKLEAALKACGIKYNLHQIRGGTDGARLSFMGLPTPNIFAGYDGAHGPYEWASLNAMEKSFEVIKEIVTVK
ncbi:MAG: peptidase T [Elusimicrobium sp.]|jgi:tripeptide aminopeptidase|nr:peptidase T [Elusimicrobium sp.]